MTIVEQIEHEITVLEAKADRMRGLLEEATAAAADIAALDAPATVPVEQPELAEQGKPESIPPPVGANGGGPEASVLAAEPTTRAKDAVRREGAADRVKRSGRVAEGEENKVRILDVIKESGAEGIKVPAIAKQLKMNPSTVRGHMRHLSKTGLVVSQDLGGGPTGGLLYRAAEVGLAPADDDGARTGEERKLVGALRAAPSALTTSEAAKNAGVNTVEAASILSGLARRGVVRDVPRREDHHPRRWLMPVEAVAA